MKRYEIVDDLTSDIMFKIHGNNKKELFENSAKALFSIITNNISKVKYNKKVLIHIKEKNIEALFLRWLNELIALVDIEEMFFSKFNIKKISSTEVIAEIYGDKISEKNAGTTVKAVTYYGFNIEKQGKGKKYIATVSFDI